jgi:hypothetical protein
MSISSQLVQTKINSGGIAQFGASMSTLIPELSPCGDRFGFDQYGRQAPPDSVDSLTCPGMFSSEVRINVENSLRPFLSPRYFDLPVGISGGADTLFGNAAIGGRVSIAGYDKNIPIETSMLSGANKNINSNLAFSALAQKYTGTTNYNSTTSAPEQEGMAYNSMY